VAGSCEHNNKHSDHIKAANSLTVSFSIATVLQLAESVCLSVELRPQDRMSERGGAAA
jgi:hypothetical protein